MRLPWHTGINSGYLSSRRVVIVSCRGAHGIGLDLHIGVHHIRQVDGNPTCRIGRLTYCQNLLDEPPPAASLNEHVGDRTLGHCPTLALTLPGALSAIGLQCHVRSHRAYPSSPPWPAYRPDAFGMLLSQPFANTLPMRSLDESPMLVKVVTLQSDQSCHRVIVPFSISWRTQSMACSFPKTDPNSAPPGPQYVHFSRLSLAVDVCAISWP